MQGLMSRAVILLALLALGGCSLYSTGRLAPARPVPKSALPIAEVKINSVPLKVEVAQTEEAKAQGLSGRVSLPNNSGMLFVFAKSDRYGFWMKDMNFPLDFIWLEKGIVVEVTENVPHPTTASPQPRTIMPTVPIDAVIEVNAGWVKEHGIELGDRVEGLTGW